MPSALTTPASSLPRLVCLQGSFTAATVLGLASEKGKEKEAQFKLLSMTGAGDKQVSKDVFVVDVSVKDLDTPRYKLYFQDVEHMRQWENRLTAWLDMHATA